MEKSSSEIIDGISKLRNQVDRADLLDSLFERELSTNEISQLKKLFDDEDTDLCINRYLLLFAVLNVSDPDGRLVENELAWHTNFLWFSAYLAKATKKKIYRDVLCEATQSRNVHIAETSSNLLYFVEEF